MTITLYGRDPNQCIGCRTTELAFKRFGVVPDKVMVDEDEKAFEFVKSLGYQQVPVVVVRDDEGNVTDHWGSFRIEKIRSYKSEDSASQLA